MIGRIMNLKGIFPRFRLLAAVLLAAVMLALAAAALIEFRVLGLARRTFVFYTIDSGDIAVEVRMLRHSSSREGDIARYVEEALLGPVSPDSLPLFPRGTELKSLLYRDGVVFADFSEDAMLPPPEGGEVLRNFETLRSGIKRNFPFVGEVRFFIGGRAAFAADFRREREFAGLEGNSRLPGPQQPIYGASEIQAGVVDKTVWIRYTLSNAKIRSM